MRNFRESFTRREFLQSTMVAAGGGILLVGSLPTPSFAVGNSELTILSDGNLSIPLNFVLPASIDVTERKQFLDAAQISQDVLTPDCNVSLWRSENRLVLFDVGAGSNFMPTAGKLEENLLAADIDPADITDVVFTHAHPDHLWGLLDDFDELLFSDATYHMNELEWDYWRAEDTLRNTPDAQKGFVVGARNRFPHIEEKISLFKFGDELLTGIEAVDTRGHTPGHTSFVIHDAGDSLFIVGDAITNVDISFRKPYWPSGTDQDQELGRKTRLNLLDRLATDKNPIVGFHLPQPGTGRVERRGDNFRFVAG